LTSNHSSANLLFIVKKKLLLTLLFLITLFPVSNAFTFEGPLQVKNQLPLFMYVNAPYLEAARIENSFSASFSYSSIYMVRESTEWHVGLDMEVTELNLRLKKNIKDFLEVGVDMPIASYNSGFMDGFLHSYHEAFGFPDYGRSNRPDNEFLYNVKRNGAPVVDGRGGRITIGDIRLSLKKPILYGDPAISIKGDLEFPTGDAKDGYGNGSIDAGIAMLFDKKLSEKIKTYFNIGAVFPGDLKGQETVELKEYIYGGAGIEAYLLNNLSLLGQVFFQNSPYPKTDIPAVDRTAVLLSFGGRYLFGKNSFELSLTEDPNTSGAPDFTLNFSYKRNF
jgi:hypothetical protein